MNELNNAMALQDLSRELQGLIDAGVYISRKRRLTIYKLWERKKKGGDSDGEDPRVASDTSRTEPMSYYSDVMEELVRGRAGKYISDNESIGKDVLKEFMKGVESLEKARLTTHPYIEEEITLHDWKNKPSSELVVPELVEVVEGYNPKSHFDGDFYRKKILELLEVRKTSRTDKKSNAQTKKGKKKETKPEKKAEGRKLAKKKDIRSLKIREEALGEELIAQWEGLLEQKKNSWFMKQLEQWREKFIKELYERIDKYEELQQILSPYYSELGRLWDLSKSPLRNTGFDVLRHYADLIERQKEFLELAEYLGRMNAEREELKKEIIMTTTLAPAYKVEEALKEEIIGIHESNDINHLVPFELSYLGDPTLETLFYLKFAENKLLTYDLIGRTLTVESELTEEERSKSEDKKGPIIICVDTSGSMHGVPEKIAKTLCFAILRVALLQGRRCYLISFSTQSTALELTDFERNLDSLIQFLSMSFHGGTDASPALRESLRMLKDENYMKADVLMISDFIMGSLPQKVEKEIRKRQDEGTRFHSLLIGRSGNQQVLSAFDNNWLYDVGSSKPFKQILEHLEELRRTPEVAETPPATGDSELD